MRCARFRTRRSANCALTFQKTRGTAQDETAVLCMQEMQCNMQGASSSQHFCTAVLVQGRLRVIICIVRCMSWPAIAWFVMAR